MTTKKILSFNASNDYMRMAGSVLTVALIFIGSISFAQNPGIDVLNSMKELHQALVKKDSVAIGKLTHFNLSYGHSNGWLETKFDFLKNNKSGFVDYHSFSEDSINIVVTGNVACARFIADINSSRAGNPPAAYHLKVLEVWIMEKKQWILLVRQAVK